MGGPAAWVGSALFGYFDVEVDAHSGGVGTPCVAVFPLDLLREEVSCEGAGLAWHLLDSDVGDGHADGDAGGGRDWPERVVRNHVDVVGFGRVGDLEGFGDAADDAEVGAAVVDALVFDDFSEGPLGPPVLSGG